jgi:hypothetical protein
MPTKSVTVTHRAASGAMIGMRFDGCRAARGNSDCLHIYRLDDVSTEVALYKPGWWVMVKTETDDLLDFVAYAKYPKLKD